MKCSTLSLWVCILSALSLASSAQEKNTTSGTCSPIITNPKADLTIKCTTAGLTPAEAKKQAQEYAEILNRIRQQNLSMKDVLDRLDAIKNDLQEVKRVSGGRHLSDQQKTDLANYLRPFGIGTVDVYTNFGDAEAAGYAWDFVLLERRLGFKGVEDAGYGQAQYLDRIVGLHFVLNQDDNAAGQIPRYCTAYFEGLKAFVGNVIGEQNKEVPRGTCRLIVGFKG